MKSLRKVIRKLILESEGITNWEVLMASADERNKRYIGHYAKKIFAQKADINYLKSLTYIHTKSVDKVDNFLNYNTRDELSCIVVEGGMYDGAMEIPYDFSDIVGVGRIGFVIEGHPTWVQNRNAATGHSERLLRDRHGGIRPSSGVNKAPTKMYAHVVNRRGLPDNAFDGAILDREDAEMYGLRDFDDRPNKNNEALVDNWSCTAVIKIIRHPDAAGKPTPDYHRQVDEALVKIRSRWPDAEIIEVAVD